MRYINTVWLKTVFSLGIDTRKRPGLHYNLWCTSQRSEIASSCLLVGCWVSFCVAGSFHQAVHLVSRSTVEVPMNMLELIIAVHHVLIPFIHQVTVFSFDRVARASVIYIPGYCRRCWRTYCWYPECSSLVAMESKRPWCRWAVPWSLLWHIVFSRKLYPGLAFFVNRI